jgi:3'-5' exonuclease
MIKLFFDIETIPSSEDQKAMYLEILKKKTSNGDKTDRQMYESTSFDGTFGRLCCIGVIKEGPQGILQQEVLEGDEKEMLEKFWECARDVTRYVGHNIWAFDLPFIYKRSIINGVRPHQLNFARYRNIPIYDTMMEWDLWNMDRYRNVSLDTLSKVLGFPTSKDDMDGSMVWPYYKAGKMDKICQYCMKDVELTRKVYYKMTFEPVPSDLAAEFAAIKTVPLPELSQPEREQRIDVMVQEKLDLDDFSLN